MKKTAIIMLFLLIPLGIFAEGVSPTVVRAYLNMAEGVMLNGSYGYAMDLYDTVLKMDTDNTEALVGKGSCYRMLGDIKMSESLYERARAIRPGIIIPGLAKYRERDMKKGGMSNERIKKAYYELMGKKWIKEKLLSFQAAPAGGKPQAAGQGITPPAESVFLPEAVTPDAKVTAEDKNKMILANKEWWIRGGKAKMEALGGIKLVYQDMSTALDGAAFGIDAGYLFRKQVSLINASPFAGYYYRNTSNPAGTDRFHAFDLSTEYSLGDVNYSNGSLFFSLKPVYHYSQDLGEAPDFFPPITPTESFGAGNFYGGDVILGIRPAPVFALAGSADYQYSPYLEGYDDGKGNSLAAISLYSRLNWQAGLGINITEDILKAGELDITSSFGTYNPPADAADITNTYFLNLPRSMIFNFVRNIVSFTQVVSGLYPPWYNQYTVSTLAATGYDSKTDVHWMYGNGLHEVFAYFEVPNTIKFSAATDTTIKNFDDSITLSEVSTPMTEIGTASMFIFKAGVRNDFNYVTTAFLYEHSSKDITFTAKVPAEFLEFPNMLEGVRPFIGMPNFSVLNFTGGLYENSYRIIAGVNIKPVWVVTIPVEYEYYLSALKFARDGPEESMAIAKSVRVGLELKPSREFSFRGGMSYDTILNNSPLLPEPGSASNPLQLITGYHAGIGIEVPTFEWNITAAVKYFRNSPKNPAELERYYLTVFTDMNFYM